MEDDSGTGLPASIEAAWGLRDRPGKGPKPGLSLDRIVAAAITVADSDGLAAVSMSRVAKQIGAATMSLYRYLSAKDELLDLMADAGYGEPPASRGTDETWRAALTRWAWAELTAFRRHPWLRQIPISGPPITPRQIGWMEAGLAALRDTGLTTQEQLSTIMLLSGYARNWATITLDMAEAAAATGSTAEEAMAVYGARLSRLVDAARFPNLAKVLAAGAVEADDDGPDDEFVFGLDRVLDGIEALVRTRAAAAS
jgi:AcrR family transcriptional regulator